VIRKYRHLSGKINNISKFQQVGKMSTDIFHTSVINLSGRRRQMTKIGHVDPEICSRRSPQRAVNLALQSWLLGVINLAADVVRDNTCIGRRLVLSLQHDSAFRRAGPSAKANTCFDYSAPDSGAECCGERVSMSVCLSVCLSVRNRIFGTARPIFTQFLCVLPNGRGSVLLWLRLYFRLYR